MKKLFWIILFSMIAIRGNSQDFRNILPEGPPATPRENIQLLFTGLAIQIVGIGVTGGSTYLLFAGPEEIYDIGSTGLGFGLGLTAAGTAMMAGSIQNIIDARRAIHDIKKFHKNNGVSFRIEPTNYGVGIVCRF